MTADTREKTAGYASVDHIPDTIYIMMRITLEPQDVEAQRAKRQKTTKAELGGLMDPDKRQALENAGWRFGDAADFLAMTGEERQLLDVRVEAALAVRRQRQALHLSQKQLASRIKTSQPRIAKIERAAADVSLEQILRAFAAAGGRIVVRPAAGSRATKPANTATSGRQRAKRTRRRHATSEVTIELVGGTSA